MKYDYYGLKRKLDLFLDLYDEKIINEGWIISSKKCDNCEKYKEDRSLNEEYVYETITGVKKINDEFLFVEKFNTTKHMKTILNSARNKGLVVNDDGLITDVKIPNYVQRTQIYPS
jgi:hypothetical protein